MTTACVPWIPWNMWVMQWNMSVKYISVIVDIVVKCCEMLRNVVSSPERCAVPRRIKKAPAHILRYMELPLREKRKCWQISIWIHGTSDPSFSFFLLGIMSKPLLSLCLKVFRPIWCDILIFDLTSSPRFWFLPRRPQASRVSPRFRGENLVTSLRAMPNPYLWCLWLGHTPLFIIMWVSFTWVRPTKWMDQYQAWLLLQVSMHSTFVFRSASKFFLQKCGSSDQEEHDKNHWHGFERPHFVYLLIIY